MPTPLLGIHEIAEATGFNLPMLAILARDRQARLILTTLIKRESDAAARKPPRLPRSADIHDVGS